MKQEQYLQLLPLEKQLKSAKESSYARLSAKEFDSFCDTYKDIFGKELTRNEKNCNTCRLKALKKVADEYFKFQGWYLSRWGRRPEDIKEETPKDEAEKNNNPEE